MAEPYRQQMLREAVESGLTIPIVVDQDIVEYWWDVLNDVIFDNYLTEPERFVFKRFHDAHGWCVPYRRNNRKNRRVRIGLNTNLCTLYDLLCILVHEMVHAWEWQHIGIWGDDDLIQHGKAFYSWREVVHARAGLPLQKTYHIQTISNSAGKTVTCKT